MTTRRKLLQGLGLAGVATIGGCSIFKPGAPAGGLSAEPYRLGPLIHQDDFHSGLARWRLEAQEPSNVTTATGILDIDAPEGFTAWFAEKLIGPVLIEYEALLVSKGGANDQVSDLNAFWMATDPGRPGDLMSHPRSGAFSTYDTLQTYYVGQGGNRNTTTRFRRYIGKAGDRPILPEHDLRGAEDMLVPNRWQTVRLVAFDNLIQYWRDGRKLFELNDPQPYTEGWFGIRTTKNHLQVRNLKIYRLSRR